MMSYCPTVRVSRACRYLLITLLTTHNVAALFPAAALLFLLFLNLNFKREIPKFFIRKVVNQEIYTDDKILKKRAGIV